jgi:hypothetical protein
MLVHGYGRRRRRISAVITPPCLVGHVNADFRNHSVETRRVYGALIEREDGAHDATIDFQLLAGTA